MQVRLFGGARLEKQGDEPVRGRAAHRRRLAVLALLCASPAKGISRERVVAYLWPDDDAEKGRRLLSEALYLLRKELGDDAIVTAGDMLQAGRDLRSDVGDFRSAIADGRLDDAVQLHSAPFLDAWYVDGAPEFERWSSETRDGLARELRDAILELARRAAAKESWTEAAKWLGRLARLEPHSPGIALKLAHAIDRSGERAAALRALVTHEERLRDDLELPLSPEVVACMTTLRANAPSAPRPARSREGAAASLTWEAPAAANDTADPLAAGVPTSPPRSRRAREFAALALVAAVGVALALRSQVARRPAASTPAYDPRHIAVMYFDDHSEGRKLGHIADGLTEELIHQLAQVGALRVVSRNGVKRFRDNPLAPDSLAAALKAGIIVEGSVQESRDSLRATVQVIDGNTGLHIESKAFARLRTELFAMQEDLARSVAASLRRKLGETFTLSALERGTDNSAALELVLRARTLRNDAARIALHPHENDARSALQMLGSADSLLQSAQRMDPDWIRPPLERGWTLLQQASLARDPDAVVVLRRAADVGAQATGMEGKNAEALELRGVAAWRLLTRSMQESADSPAARRSEADLRAALAIDSTRAHAWATIADIVAVRGELAESELAAERALQQDAWLDGAERAYFRGFAAAHMLGRVGDAIRWCKRGQLIFPDSWRFYECELTAMREDSVAPDPAHAWALVAKLDSLDPPASASATGHAFSPIFRRAVAAAISARAGDERRARLELETLRTLVAGDSALTLDLLYNQAYVLDRLGDAEEATLLLDSLFRARPMLRLQGVRDPLLRRLRHRLSR